MLAGRPVSSELSGGRSDPEKPQARTKFKAPGAAAKFSLKSASWGLVPFSIHQRTRLTLAYYPDGQENGFWVVTNVGDALHLNRLDATDREPYRKLNFATGAKNGFPTCHAFCHPASAGAQPGATKDTAAADLLVGLADGQVHLMSLRSQLQAPAPAARPQLLATLTPDVAPNEATPACTAVAWVPSTDVFVAAFSNGLINVYKKSSVLAPAEGLSKWTLTSSRAAGSSTPSSSWALGTGINDVAVSPDGSKLAAACRDGTLRLIDLASGDVVGGTQSYYGALLCCCFNAAGSYVATGGEDDMIAIYGVEESCAVYHGEGHSSWVSRVAFDPWARLPPILGTTPAATATAATEPASTSNGGFGGSSGLAPATAVPQRQVQRLASVGQDGCLCLWDVQLPPEADLLPFEIPGPGGRLRKIRSVGSALELAAQAGNGDSSAGGGSGGGLRRPPGGSGAGLEAVTPCPPHALMNIVQPVQRCRIHLEPLSDLLFTEQCVFTADQTANTKCWARPVPPAAVGPGSQSSQMMEDDGGDFGQQGTQTAMMSQ